jgi:hypothetical protein
VTEPQRRPRWTGLVAPAVAGVLAALAGIVGWRGVDVPAQLYRIDLFHRAGFTIWDSQWYGGHWTLGYSVVFPPLAGVLGLGLTAVACAALAAYAFDRIVTEGLGDAARVGSVVFAVWTLAQVAIGQLPFLLGEAIGLCGLLAAMRRRWALAVVLTVLAALASPLAGAFVVLAVAAWLVTDHRHDVGARVALGAAPAACILLLGLLFPGQGRMPFRAVDALLMVASALAVVALARGHPTIRNGAALYAAATACSLVLPSPLGANILRLGQCVGAPVLVCMLWPHRRRLVLLAVGMIVALGIWQWSPTTGAFSPSPADQSVHQNFYAPLVAYLRSVHATTDRVEVVPTERHWEAAYVAADVPLARGWERQLDTENNPLFYRHAPIAPATYRSWLIDNGVKYVALPDAPLDFAAVDEAGVIRKGVPGLRLVWHNANWHVYAVEQGSGIVSGPARLQQANGGEVVLMVTRPGTITVRVRYSPHWVLIGPTGDCVRKIGGHWTGIEASRPGQVRLVLRLRAGHRHACD